MKFDKQSRSQSLTNKLGWHAKISECAERGLLHRFNYIAFTFSVAYLALD